MVCYGQVVLDPRHCSIESLSYRDSPKAAELSVPVAVLKGKVVHKLTGDEWLPPRSGWVTVHFEQAVYKPTAADAIRDQSFETLQLIVENGRTEEDRRNWMALLCQVRRNLDLLYHHVLYMSVCPVCSVNCRISSARRPRRSR